MPGDRCRNGIRRRMEDETDSSVTTYTDASECLNQKSGGSYVC